MKLLSFHPFSLYSNSGGARILRRLYDGYESNVISLTVTPYKSSLYLGPIEEKTIFAEPIQYSWMRWRLRDLGSWIRESIYFSITTKKIIQIAESLPSDIIHVTNHYCFSTALLNMKSIKNKRLWTSFHDHYSTVGSSIDETKLLWIHSERRLVISNELGVLYQELFGAKEFEIITDGVSNDELSKPKQISVDKNPITIYFSGLLHYDYNPLFQSLADTLDKLSQLGFCFKLILRGTHKLSFLSGRAFSIEYREVTFDNRTLKDELDSADILYLPMKFNSIEFYKYSLSTKMVSYLGASGTILYHGPSDSAICHLLKDAESAICCNNLEIRDLSEAILSIVNNRNNCSKNSKILALSKFNLDLIRNKFWQVPV